MTTITLPIKREDHAPEIQELEKRELNLKELNWMGRIVYWIRSSNSQGIIIRVVVHTVAILIALALAVSIIGTPILIYANREIVRQEERSRTDHKFEVMSENYKDHAHQEFLIGRTGALDGFSPRLGWFTRRAMIRDLKKLGLDQESSSVPLEKLQDIDLLRIVAIKYENYITKYGLRISTGPWLF